MTRRRFRGFTLVELMAVVAILAVLSTVAMFSYKSYTRKARIQEGAAFLMDIKLKQETYFMTYSRYVDTANVPDDFFPALPMIPAPWLQGGLVWDCANPSGTAMIGFCALGLMPNSDVTFFQYVTMGWQPGDMPPPNSPQGPYIRDANRRWWFARAQTYMGRPGELPYELRLSSEIMEMMEIPPEAH